MFGESGGFGGFREFGRFGEFGELGEFGEPGEFGEFGEVAEFGKLGEFWRVWRVRRVAVFRRREITDRGRRFRIIGSAYRSSRVSLLADLSPRKGGSGSQIAWIVARVYRSWKVCHSGEAVSDHSLRGSWIA